MQQIYERQHKSMIAPMPASANGVSPLAGYQLSAPFPNGLPPPAGTAAGLSIDLGDSLEGLLRRQNIAYQENYSLDAQRNLPGNFVITAAFAGNEGVHLMVNEQLNQLPTSDEALGAGLNKLVPNPLFGLIDPASSINTPTVKQSRLFHPFPQFQNFEADNVGIGHSSYNAGQLTVEHRLNYGLALLFVYTYSKAIDNVGEQTSVAGEMGAFTNTYCPSCDRSRSGQNETNALSWTTRYELPFGKGKPFLGAYSMAERSVLRPTGILWHSAGALAGAARRRLSEDVERRMAGCDALQRRPRN
jgi:hypothetical protein